MFTWTGCQVQVEGEPDVVYESDETPMGIYLNVHHILEQRRQSSTAASSLGPRVLVVGPTDSGKSTLCKILANYAVRMGWQPALVDVDIGQGSVTVPGCLAAVALDEPVDIEEGVPLESPLVYYFGAVTPSDALEHYRALVERLAAVLQQRALGSPKAAASGLLVNTMGWVDGAGYDLLLHQVKAEGLSAARKAPRPFDPAPAFPTNSWTSLGATWCWSWGRTSCTPSSAATAGRCMQRVAAGWMWSSCPGPGGWSRGTRGSGGTRGASGSMSTSMGSRTTSSHPP